MSHYCYDSRLTPLSAATYRLPAFFHRVRRFRIFRISIQRPESLSGPRFAEPQPNDPSTTDYTDNTDKDACIFLHIRGIRAIRGKNLVRKTGGNIEASQRSFSVALPARIRAHQSASFALILWCASSDARHRPITTGSQHRPRCQRIILPRPRRRAISPGIKTHEPNIYQITRNVKNYSTAADSFCREVF
jgi:hypothetical protein